MQTRVRRLTADPVGFMMLRLLLSPTILFPAVASRALKLR